MDIEQVIKQVNRFSSPQEKAAVNLIYTGSWFRDRQQTMLKKFGLLPQHYNVLRILKGRKPEPVSPGQIKEVMLEKGNDITRLLDKLVEKGLVNRGLCEENRRKMDVFITDKGIQLLKEIEVPLKKELEVIRKRITDKEAQQLSRLLDKLRG